MTLEFVCFNIQINKYLYPWRCIANSVPYKNKNENKNQIDIIQKNQRQESGAYINDLMIINIYVKCHGKINLSKNHLLDEYINQNVH